MKVVVFVVVLSSICFALPQKRKPDFPNPQSVTILQQLNDNIGLGHYNFAYQTSDGVSREETAELKNVGSENEALVVQGSYTYIGPDGTTYTVNYIADENGYRPSGSHLPKA